MSSPALKTTIATHSLPAQLQQIGLRALPANLDGFEWNWPTKIERDVIERALTLDFLPEARALWPFRQVEQKIGR